MKFAWIAAEEAHWPVRAMCRALCVSPQGFYAWKSRQECNRDRDDARLSVLIDEAHARSRGTYGSPRARRARGRWRAGEPQARIRLMRKRGLRGRGRRRYRVTTDSNHGQPVAANLLGRDFTASRPNERWVGDVTELRTPSGPLYLAAIVDMYSRLVVGCALSAVNDRRLALRALEAAVHRRSPPRGLLHHTDQGSPFASEDYQRELERLGVDCSMSRRGNCYDNAPMESWFDTLKVELGELFESAGDANRKLFDYIEVFYNYNGSVGTRHSGTGLQQSSNARRARDQLSQTIRSNPQVASLPPGPPSWCNCQRRWSTSNGSVRHYDWTQIDQSTNSDHPHALPDDAKLRLVVLITEAVAERAGGLRTRLTDLDGLGRDAWEGVDPDAYVRALRDEWQGRP